MLMMSQMVQLEDAVRPVRPTIVSGWHASKLSTLAASAEEKKVPLELKNWLVQRYMSNVKAIAGGRCGCQSRLSHIRRW
jgi:hypothetical protein